MSEEHNERPDWGVLVTLNREPAYILQNIAACHEPRVLEVPGGDSRIAVCVRWTHVLLDVESIKEHLRIRARFGQKVADFRIVNVQAAVTLNGDEQTLDLTEMQFVTGVFRGLKLPKRGLVLSLVVAIDGNEAEYRIGELEPSAPPVLDIPVPPPAPEEKRKQVESAIRLEAIKVSDTATVRHGLRVHLIAPIPGTDVAWLLSLKAFVRSPTGQGAYVATHATPTGGDSWTLFMETSTTERLFAVDDPRFTEDYGIVLTTHGARQAFDLLLGVNLRLNA